MEKLNVKMNDKQINNALKSTFYSINEKVVALHKENSEHWSDPKYHELCAAMECVNAAYVIINKQKI